MVGLVVGWISILALAGQVMTMGLLVVFEQPLAWHPPWTGVRWLMQVPVSTWPLLVVPPIMAAMSAGAGAGILLMIVRQHRRGGGPPRAQGHGSARWATRGDIRRMGLW